MAKASYWELLKHPKWQAKRLEVMQRASFRCEWCGDDGTTLHVHHTYYDKGAKPWEYPSADLLCLCERCHERVEYLTREISRLVGRLSKVGEFAMETLVGYTRAMIAGYGSDGDRESRFVPIDTPDEAVGVSHLVNGSWEELLERAISKRKEGGKQGLYIGFAEDN